MAALDGEEATTIKYVAGAQAFASETLSFSAIAKLPRLGITNALERFPIAGHRREEWKRTRSPVTALFSKECKWVLDERHSLAVV